MPIVVNSASDGRAFVLGTSVNTPKARALQPGLTMIDVPDTIALARFAFGLDLRAGRTLAVHGFARGFKRVGAVISAPGRGGLD